MGKFSLQAITEDIDLSFKLNKAKYKVEQSLYRIETFVPSSLKSRYKQKVRRNSGGTQCSLKYPLIWLRNPLHVLTIVSFNLLIMGLIIQAIKSYDLFVIIFMQDNAWKAFWIVFNLKRWLNLIFVKSSFSLLSIPYVIPLIKSWKGIRKILLIIPYSIIYVPIYSFVGMVGFITGAVKYRGLEKQGKRAW